MPINIRRWSEDEWQASESSWAALLTASDADPLFLSWHWLRMWWRHFGQGRFELLLVAGYAGDTLVGVAPLCSMLERRGPLALQSIQFIGGQLRHQGSTGALAEYLDVVALPKYADSFRREVAVWLVAEANFDRLAINFCPHASLWIESLTKVISQRRFSLRPEIAIRSHQALLNGDFAAYLRAISASSRRKIFNQRRILESRGSIAFNIVTGREPIAAALSTLNRLHAQRWGTEVYSPRLTAFFVDLMCGESESSVRPVVTQLTVSGTIVSVLHDIRVGERQYNIQLGFDATLDRRLSLGLLHLGFAMQDAAGAGVQVYDFLAGGGRLSDYKPQLSQRYADLATIQVYRGLILASALKGYDWLRSLKQLTKRSRRLA